MSLYTLEELNTEIAAIKAAKLVVITGGQSYRLNDTQGDIQVSRTSLEKLNIALRILEAEYNELLNEGSDIVSIWSGR